MTREEKILYKQQLKQTGLDLIGQRIANTRLQMEEAQEAANQEGKSSAGDKYETARAMSHLQKDMFARQLAEQTREQAALHAVDADKLYDTARAGAVLQGETLTFFIAAGLGKQTIGGKSVLFLSPLAPLAQQLQHKKQGDHFVFNGIKTIIADLF